MDVIAGAPGILTPFGIFGPYDLKVYRNNGGGSFTRSSSRRAFRRSGT